MSVFAPLSELFVYTFSSLTSTSFPRSSELHVTGCLCCSGFDLRTSSSLSEQSPGRSFNVGVAAQESMSARAILAAEGPLDSSRGRNGENDKPRLAREDESVNESTSPLPALVTSSSGTVAATQPSFVAQVGTTSNRTSTSEISLAGDAQAASLSPHIRFSIPSPSVAVPDGPSSNPPSGVAEAGGSPRAPPVSESPTRSPQAPPQTMHSDSAAQFLGGACPPPSVHASAAKGRQREPLAASPTPMPRGSASPSLTPTRGGCPTCEHRSHSRPGLFIGGTM